jgi:hypothetical protein
MNPYDAANTAANLAIALIGLAGKLIATAKRSGELTPDEEKALDAKQAEMLASSAAKIEPDPV